MNQQTNQDIEHLKILSICYYILSGLCLFPLLYGLFYVIVGIFFGAVFMSADMPNRPGDPPAALFGGIFVVIGLVVAAISLTFGILILMAGRNIARHRSYTYCFVVSCIICLFMPLGTILGVFSIIVLLRDSVKGIFNGQSYQQFGSRPPNWQ